MLARLVSSESLSPWPVSSPLFSGSPVIFPLCVCVLIPSSHNDVGYIGLGLTLMTSLNLNYAFKSAVYKYSQILAYWGLGPKHLKGWREHN